MNTLVIYDSVYGNTAQIANAIASTFEQYGPTKVAAANSTSVLDLTGIDLLALGGPTQGHGVSPAIRDLLDKVPSEELLNIGTIAFDTRMDFARWLSGSAASTIGKKLEQYQVNLLVPPESFLVAGREGPLKEGELERAAEWAHMIAENLGAAAVVG
jgi:flavodoxin I